MTTKHTPGPWRFENGDYPNQCLIGSDGTHIADRIPHTHNEEANAALIAAAPTMLQALQEILEGLEHAGCSSPHCSGTCHYCATRRRARTAINKATRAL